jgi:hypothetical protein
VLANAYRIVDEKLEKCIPCELKGVGKETEKKVMAKKPTVKETPVKRAVHKR